MKNKIISITREDVTEYLKNAERTKTDLIKDHVLRILEVETKNNIKLKAKNVHLNRLCSDLMIVNEDLRIKIERLEQIAKRNHLKLVK